MDTFARTIPTKPVTIYAAAKLSLYLVAQQMTAAAGANLAWARFFYLYGPTEDRRRLVPAVMTALARNERFAATAGEQVRDYLHIEDAADALAVMTEQSASGAYNVCSGVPLTLKALLETIGRVVGKPHLIDYGATPYRDWEPMFICGDNSRLRALGWAPHYSLEEGIQHTYLRLSAGQWD
ncbi:MAG: NAD-dependent epimerase/dehydratase family protein [Polyangiaceae bacterium]